MHSKIVPVIFFLTTATVLATSDVLNDENNFEARGKKKIAMFVYIAELVLKKLFFLKLVFAFVVWLLCDKIGYLLRWLAVYFKDKKVDFHPEPYHHHVEYEHQHYGHYDPQPQYGYHQPQYEQPPSNYGPYRRTHGLNRQSYQGAR